MASVHGAPPGSLGVNQNKARPFTVGGTIPGTDCLLPKSSFGSKPKNFYVWPNNSLPPKVPAYSFNKDKSQNFLEVAQRNGK